MFQGFYNLASSVLTHQRKLNVIGNNMVNVSTPGFRYDTYIETTFQDEMIYRIGNTDKSNPTPIGSMSAIVAGGGNVTNYEEARITQTGSVYDFAIRGDGFFAIQEGDRTLYTRNGSFVIDDEGYLYLDGVGRVLGEEGPIQLGTDKITADTHGNIYKVPIDTGSDEDSSDDEEEELELLGTIRVVDFEDYDTQLEKTTGDMFIATAEGQNVETPEIMWKTLEDSNVDAIKEMTNMISTQRALQASAQILKMYDQLSGQIVKIGPA